MQAISFQVVAHNYFVTEQAINEIYIFIRRELRQSSFTTMRMLAPTNSFMGMDTVLVVKHKGQPAIYHNWRLLLSTKVIQEGTTDHNGMSFGLEIDTSADCHCLPKWFKHTAVNDAKEPDLNKRCCKHPIPVYTLEIYPPEPKEGIEKTLEAENDILVPLNASEALPDTDAI